MSALMTMALNHTFGRLSTHPPEIALTQATIFSELKFIGILI